MSAPTWSPTPWTVTEDEETAWVNDATGLVVLDPPYAKTAPTERERADLHRAAACVSACAGVETKALAAGVVAKPRAEAAEARLRAVEPVARRAVREVCALACRPPAHGEQCIALTAGLSDALARLGPTP